MPDISTFTESQTLARINSIKIELIDLEAQLGDSSRYPSRNDKAGLRAYYDWQSHTRKIHSDLRRELLRLKAHQNTLKNRVADAIRATREEYDPDDPDDLLAVAADTIATLARDVYGTDEWEDDVEAALTDIRTYLGRSPDMRNARGVEIVPAGVDTRGHVEVPS